MTRSAAVLTAVSIGTEKAHRVNATATRTDVADDVGGQLVRLTATATTELSTTVGEARSAADRTSLDDRTRAELYERAQELDIDGGGSLRKRELVRATGSA